ncbi:hypothetical protein SAMN04490202_4927 [Pseudomonas reinekei]|uniref:Uncharacterized protein n=1 Tax=Pseudomonas reinekei TaxID=395598 RepID=A0A1H0TTH0_PSERE|nr:hypothetical protein [Pseudomonas reinekei]SDP57259.1 hypothetical protein SAMN04490202_4927 [Pseudomonas reinekei]
MNNGLYPCTAADPMGVGPHDGLLGEGALPWPSEIASRAFPSSLAIGGLYSTDDLSAAEFLIKELSSPEAELSEDEYEEYWILLISLIAKLKKAVNVTAEQFAKIQKKAVSIPVVGPLLFSPANLPGTLASVGGLFMLAREQPRLKTFLILINQLGSNLKNGLPRVANLVVSQQRKHFVGELKLFE